MKMSIGAMALVAVMVTPLVASAQAEWTANGGWVSQYYYRGVPQKLSSASAGVDVAANAFSAGTWAADVGDGAEVDLYAAFDIAVNDNISVSLGGTGYFYTGEFDNTYLEGNLGIGLGSNLSIENSVGQYKTNPERKYNFIGITVENDGLFATIGTSAYAAKLSDAITDVFDKDLGGQYLEAGYGFSAADLDLTISGIWSDAQISGAVDGAAAPTHELTLVFGVSKAFSLN